MTLRERNNKFWAKFHSPETKIASHGKHYAIIPAIIVLIGIVLLCIPGVGFNLGLDFTGGTYMEVTGFTNEAQSIAAKDSIGVQNGLDAAKMRLGWLLGELEMLERQLAEIEQAMESALLKTGYAEQILGIKGIGVVTAASFLGEVGEPLRFQTARQISRYAGYNLVEDSSGKSKSGTVISKRGRKRLRGILYQIAFTMVGTNDEMKSLYHHLTTRKNNPLKKKQALVVISKKVITVIYSLLKKRETYRPELVLGAVRKEMIKAA